MCTHNICFYGEIRKIQKNINTFGLEKYMNTFGLKKIYEHFWVKKIYEHFWVEKNILIWSYLFQRYKFINAIPTLSDDGLENLVTSKNLNLENNKFAFEILEHSSRLSENSKDKFVVFFFCFFCNFCIKSKHCWYSLHFVVMWFKLPLIVLNVKIASLNK